jgi:hypothetical protein
VYIEANNFGWWKQEGNKTWVEKLDKEFVCEIIYLKVPGYTEIFVKPGQVACSVRTRKTLSSHSWLWARLNTAWKWIQPGCVKGVTQLSNTKSIWKLLGVFFLLLPLPSPPSFFIDSSSFFINC